MTGLDLNEGMLKAAGRLPLPPGLTIDWRHDGALALPLPEADLRHVLSSINVPTLLLYGDADKRSSLAVANELHAQIPRSRLAILRGVGHLSNVEGANQFNAEVRQFLRSSDNPVKLRSRAAAPAQAPRK